MAELWRDYGEIMERFRQINPPQDEIKRMYGGNMIGYEEKYSTIGALNVSAVTIIPPNSAAR